MDYSVAMFPLESRFAPERLFAAAVRQPNVFFLDSALQMDEIGRYSFLGWEPFAEIRFGKGRSTIHSGGEIRSGLSDPFAALAAELSRYRVLNETGLPFPAGAVGFFAYDLARTLEALPRPAKFDGGSEEMWFGLYDTVVTCDHLLGRAFVSVAVDREGRSIGGERVHDRVGRVRALIETAADAVATPYDGPLASHLDESLGRRDYCAAVERIKEYIFAGDVYQANLSTQYRARLPAPPEEIYLRLRQSNPAPFSAYLDTGSQQILSSSPERFLRKRGLLIETRPIKGTLARSKRETLASATARLMSSLKDRAELTMIIDVARNDFGRVSEFGSVRVPRVFSVEEYETVYHLVSTVTGRVRAGASAIDCIRASFPAGSITGAPKIRAMQIIDELEPVARGPYTGSLGYITFDGDCDLNILIRTMIARNGEQVFNVGAGIVSDSDPDLEYEECLAKGLALTRCLQSPALAR